jgi:3-deoxy-manno-octulosonate cytidylyltransferase (CMP-KDO synthetase)
MKIIALIPARMGSSRFPGKPMAKILGKPMIGHVYERVSRSSLLNLTAVATCDKEIFD